MVASTMTQFFGPRVILGFGAGNFDHEFAAVGLDGVPRPQLVQDNIAILRRIWTEDAVAWDRPPYAFENVTMRPRPKGDPPPLWYCGATPKAARIAAEFCDGWLPGRIAMETLRSRIRTLDETSAAHGRVRPTVGIIPSASIADTRERALSQVNVDGLLAWANHSRYWVRPASGQFERVEDLSGVLIHGTADDVTEQCAALRDAGVDHLVFDFRLTFGRWEEQMQMLGESVLPRLRA
jgi:alkanesulfonate monooxygenase SsuD/methylene tetrahydromethanopterin reductase-like flavin-dependent oxidoreductase (luciferase family)